MSENFRNALAKLEEFASMPIENDRDRAGIIQAFEFTFEQCWRAFQKVAWKEGLAAPSPRQSLQAALQLGLIDSGDEERWLQMMDDRNRTSHIYHDEVALEIGERILVFHLGLLRRAIDKLE